MKFSRKFTNKLVSYTDRHFTYDKRTMRREGTDKLFDFFAISRENGVTTSVCVDRTKQGIWASIRKDDKYICEGFLKTYTEVDNFKKMILCLG